MCIPPAIMAFELKLDKMRCLFTEVTGDGGKGGIVHQVEGENLTSMEIWNENLYERLGTQMLSRIPDEASSQNVYIKRKIG
jgi:hypothetical protein